jgi:hypothetical protein
MLCTCTWVQSKVVDTPAGKRAIRGVNPQMAKGALREAVGSGRTITGRLTMEARRGVDLNQTEELLRRAGRYPRLQAQILRMLDMVENTDGAIRTADAAEERAIEDLRVFGRELLQTWGQRYAEDAAARAVQEGGVAHQVKKTALAQHLR